jgi:tetratricopeptide (TPR) repeat protein
MIRLFISMVFAVGLAHAQNTVPQGGSRDIRYDGVAASVLPPEIPRSYALVIGIAKYRNLTREQQLEYSERDAEAIYSTLISPEGGNFKAENVHKLIGSDATVAAMRLELEDWLPAVAKRDDRVLVYFAGHGFVKDGMPYLAPYDLDPADITHTGYAMSALGDAFGGKIAAKWKVLIADACHSGAIQPGPDFQAINKSLVDVNQSVFTLTASRDREASFESADWGGGHGIFTYYVVKAMEGAADGNRDGIVTADEIADYVRRNVREATNGAQNPTSERASFDPNMLLAYVPSNAAPSAPTAPKFGTFVFETNMDGVEVFVDDRSVGIIDKGKPLRLPGLRPGVHVIKAVKHGYEPDGPREEIIYPGHESTVTVRILTARRRRADAHDALNRGVELYNKGDSPNYRQAVSALETALRIEPTFSQAALFLARAHNALFEEELARKYFKLAIEMDPDYLEARASFAAMLLDLNDADEAIRQLNLVVQRDPKNAQAFYFLAHAFRLKGSFRESIDAARKSMHLNPDNAEAHLWLAESLRLTTDWKAAKEEYGDYLARSNYDTGAFGKFNYVVFGKASSIFGRRAREASQIRASTLRDIWREQRNLGYFGLCECERKLNNFDAAIEHCRTALRYDPEDPYAHFSLGLAYIYKAKLTDDIGSAAAALKHFKAMLGINPDLLEADMARQNIFNIEVALREIRKKL